MASKKNDNTMVSFDVQELPGIGPETAKKLASFGITEITTLAMSSAPALSEQIGKPTDYCSSLIVKAQEYLDTTEVMKKSLTTSDILYNNFLTLKRFSTGDEDFDRLLLGGGIETEAITEFYGEYGKGKSQICFSTTTVAAGNGHKVLYIDTENTYSPDRIYELASRKGFDPMETLKNIYVLSAKNVALLTHYMRKVPEFVDKNNIELIIVDSIIALYRAEFLGRANLAERQQRLSEVMSYLIRVATFRKAAVIITNQVTESPDPFKIGQFATGGNVMAHASTHRIYLKGKGAKYIIAKMVDSPRYPKVEVMFKLTKSGIKYCDPSKKDTDDDDD